MGSNLDLLIINPGNRKAYQALANNLSAVEPPTWAGMLATHARNNGISVAILDTNALMLTPAEAAKKILEMKPRLAAIAVYGQNPCASTQCMPVTGAICEEIKKLDPDQKILLVGGHVTALPERTMNEEQTDYVCLGEGPYTILDLVRELGSSRPNLSKVRDLMYREGKTLVRTEAAPLLQDLDREMPGMAWDLLPMERYRAHNWHCFGHLDRREPYASFYTTLGCPFQCSFCCIQAPFRQGEKALGMKEGVNSYRFWSPKLVVDQIERLVTQYGIYNIKIADEMFVMNQKHVEGICDGIIERGLKVNIWAYVRVNTIRESMCEKLKKAGINWLCFGFESGNARVLKDVSKGYQTDEVARAVAMTRNAGIYIIANFLFGLPEDDIKSMQDTLDLAMSLNCEFANFYCAMAQPGSKLYDTALKEKWPLPKTWSGYSQLSADSLPLPTRHLSGLEVLKFRDQAFNTYFGSSQYLNMIERTFGKETLDHVVAMAGVKLERKNSC